MDIMERSSLVLSYSTLISSSSLQTTDLISSIYTTLDALTGQCSSHSYTMAFHSSPSFELRSSHALSTIILPSQSVLQHINATSVDLQTTFQFKQNLSSLYVKSSPSDTVLASTIVSSAEYATSSNISKTNTQMLTRQSQINSLPILQTTDSYLSYSKLSISKLTEQRLPSTEVKSSFNTQDSSRTYESLHSDTFTYNVVQPSMTSNVKSTAHPSSTPRGNPDCSALFTQIPDDVHITEHDSDYLLFTTIHSRHTNVSIEVTSPATISSVLQSHFQLQTPDQFSTTLLLTDAIDVDHIYHLYKTAVRWIGMKVICSVSGLQYDSKLINITVEDIDDNGPVFISADKSQCALPVYRAGAAENYVGVLYLTPEAIVAVDGDLSSTNIVSYTFLYGDPMEYTRYFLIDYRTGRVNKTSNINSTAPHDFVILVQATETSSIKRSRVAVLTVSVSPPASPSVSHPNRANRTVIIVLQIISGIVIVGFTLGFIHIIRHRNRKYKVDAFGDFDKTDSNILEDAVRLEPSHSEQRVLDFLQVPSESAIHNESESKTPETSLQTNLLKEPEATRQPTPVKPSPSPVSTRRVKIVLSEKTHKMIYGNRARKVMQKKPEPRFSYM